MYQGVVMYPLQTSPDKIIGQSIHKTNINGHFVLNYCTNESLRFSLKNPFPFHFHPLPFCSFR